MSKCAMCQSNADVLISWPINNGEQKHKVCDSCGHSVWDRISKEFNGTEAYFCFTIEPL